MPNHSGMVQYGSLSFCKGKISGRKALRTMKAKLFGRYIDFETSRPSSVIAFFSPASSDDLPAASTSSCLMAPSSLICSAESSLLAKNVVTAWQAKILLQRTCNWT
eukprot:TRINITY_DN13057_c0_g1_i1.p1 TRINITY_DN13057_c0_g1~~TRINITY_DN13057_c0_g1_i1.p1  ORF type:complete len:106 (-),score=6.61 TRINITY_DN13057_c0_g1_i1:39-356(-)